METRNQSGDGAGNKTRVGIVGAGYVSPYHIRAVQSLGFAEVVAIADPDLERARELAKQYQIPHVCADLSEMAASKPEVIHILTPPATHCRLTVQAIEMGYHVFVEKPMAESVADCEKMIAAAKAAGRVLSVNHSARMDPIVLHALERIQRGECGEVLGVDFFRSSDYPAWGSGPVPPPFRNGSYPFQDLGVHALYLVEAFLGQLERVEVRYRPTGKDPNLCFDEWTATVESANGFGRIYLSWNIRPMQNELVIHGTRGVMHVDCFLQTCTIRRTYPAPKPVQRILGAGLNSLSQIWQVTGNTLRFLTGRLRPSPGIHESARRFHLALRAGTAPPIPATEGRRVVIWMEEASKRADQDKRQMFTEIAPVHPPRILVTGSSGFLGRALLRRLLKEGESVRVLVRRHSPDLQNDSRFHVVYGDLGDRGAVERAVAGIETVYHVGAAMKGAPADFERGTVHGTRYLVDACRRAGVRRFVHVSSLSVLDHAGKRPAKITEDAPYEPYPQRRGAYTGTKMEAEKIVRQAITEHAFPAVIVRPGQIFGPGAENVTCSGSFGLAGRWIVSGGGRLRLPLVYVEDVVDALILAATKPGIEGEIFHLVDPEVITQRDYIARRQGWAKGTPVRPVYCPVWILLLLAMAVEVLGAVLKRDVPLSRYRIRSLKPLGPCDPAAASTRLGWTPAVGVRRGLLATFPSEGNR